MGKMILLISSQLTSLFYISGSGTFSAQKVLDYISFKVNESKYLIQCMNLFMVCTFKTSHKLEGSLIRNLRLGSAPSRHCTQCIIQSKLNKAC